MEYDKINNLLDSENENLSKFVTRQYVKVNSLSNTYNENKSIRFRTPMLRSDLCDYGDAYVLIEGIIIVGGNAPRDRQNRPVILKNNAPFISCITRINGELIENADDVDVVMPMYNLLEYSKNYRKTIGSLYNYYRDELDDDVDLNNHPNVNAATENRNLTAKTGNGHKRQQNRKNNSEQEKDKKPNKEQKKGKSVAILGDSMVKHLNVWEMSKKIKKL